jgi:hypothetical protein
LDKIDPSSRDPGAIAMQFDEALREKPLRIDLGRSWRKTVRIDRPGERTPEQASKMASAAESRRLLDLVWNAIRSDRSDRRGSFRHDAIEGEVWVGWWVRADFGAIDGRLLNISRGGALTILGHRPPKNEPVWIFKETEAALASVRAEVVGSTPAPDGAYAVRLRFLAPCPTILCEAVVCSHSPMRARYPAPGR